MFLEHNVLLNSLFVIFVLNHMIISLLIVSGIVSKTYLVLMRDPLAAFISGQLYLCLYILIIFLPFSNFSY